MNKCIECGSYAINHHCHGRDGSDPELCDVCYWRKRADEHASLEAERDSLQRVGIRTVEEHNAALAECERLRELLRQSLDAMRTPYSDTKLQAKIDAALSTKP